MRRTYHFFIAGLSIGLACAVFVWCRPQSVLREARFEWLVLAGSLFAASLTLWSVVWAAVLRRAVRAGGDPSPATPSFLHGFAISMAAMIGLVTPLNLGSDVLRVWYARRHLRLDSGTIVSASLLTRELKLHVTFPLVLSALLFPLADSGSAQVWLALAGLSFLEGALLLFRTEWIRPVIRRLGIEPFSQRAWELGGRLKTGQRAVAYLAFILAFVLEWLALAVSVEALDLNVSLATSAWLYVWLYLLSRTPLSVQGIGVVELGGCVALTASGLTPNETGGLLGVWAAIRLVTPLALSGLFTAWLSLLRQFLLS